MGVIHSLAVHRGDSHKLDMESGKYENPDDILLIRAQNDFEALASCMDLIQHHLNEFNASGSFWTIDDEDVVKFRAEVEKTLNMARNYIASDI